MGKLQLEIGMGRVHVPACTFVSRHEYKPNRNKRKKKNKKSKLGRGRGRRRRRRGCDLVSEGRESREIEIW